jgi:DNA-binding response OmpR family regulator
MRIAIADDDESTRNYLHDLLTGAGHSCVAFHNGRETITALQRDTFDLLLLDWNMPRASGVEVVLWARANIAACAPIIILTNRADDGDVVRGLEAGADDYIVKPASTEIILARINAVARRREVSIGADNGIERYGAYRFEQLAGRAWIDNDIIMLTAKEMALALLFFHNHDRPLSRAYILEAVWNSVPDLPTRTLDVHVSKIRSKLALRPQNGYQLQTIFGYGYRLDTVHAAAA